jgi:hypothetical protein
MRPLSQLNDEQIAILRARAKADERGLVARLGLSQIAFLRGLTGLDIRGETYARFVAELGRSSDAIAGANEGKVAR